MEDIYMYIYIEKCVYIKLYSSKNQVRKKKKNLAGKKLFMGLLYLFAASQMKLKARGAREREGSS